MENSYNICGFGASICTIRCVAVVCGKLFEREARVALAQIFVGHVVFPFSVLGISSFSTINGASV